MSKWKIYTPEGVQDVLVEECFVKRNMEQNVRNLFKSLGYYEVETPTLEFFDVFSSETDTIPQETMFKFFDQHGRILVLRPDITIPIARLTATKYRERSYPLKYFYIGNTFRYNEFGGGKQKEFTQAGVEFLGAGTPEADAEVIATAINAIRASGLENFQIDIGQVEFFKGLMEETGLTGEDVEQLRILIDKKDYLGIEEIVEHHTIRQDLKELILSLPGLFGTSDVIDRVEKITVNEKSLKALANLRQILDILEDYELSKYISVDLGMVQSLDYYTGIIFRGFTYGVGFPILSGGRYDNLVEKFGRPCCATGFSIGINLIMMAIDRQKIEVGSQSVDSLICYQKSGRKTAFLLRKELRRQGLSIEIDVLNSSVEYLKEYSKTKKIGGILHIIDEDNIEVINALTDEVSRVRISDLINKQGMGGIK